LLSNHSTLRDFSRERGGGELAGPGWRRWLVRLPGNEVLTLEVNEKRLVVPRLEPALDGLSIAHLSDLHFTGVIGRRFFEKVVERVNEMEPDLVAVTGDLLDKTRCIDWVPYTLGRLRARHGAFFVLGNHDLRVDWRRLRETLEDAGLVDLAGRWHTVSIEGRMTPSPLWREGRGEGQPGRTSNIQRPTSNIERKGGGDPTDVGGPPSFDVGRSMLDVRCSDTSAMSRPPSSFWGDGRPGHLILAGNELPWFRNVPDMSACPQTIDGHRPLRVLLSHSPDQIGWARTHDFDLLLAGHNHGGQIRLPLVGPVFSPSCFGVKYASGTFEESPTLMHVSRGISGKTPLRYNCPPELTKLVLSCPATPARQGDCQLQTSASARTNEP
jgi:predicted MPP superfamily phosphohydrolase